MDPEHPRNALRVGTPPRNSGRVRSGLRERIRYSTRIRRKALRGGTQSTRKRARYEKLAIHLMPACLQQASVSANGDAEFLQAQPGN